MAGGRMEKRRAEYQARWGGGKLIPHEQKQAFSVWVLRTRDDRSCGSHIAKLHSLQ